MKEKFFAGIDSGGTKCDIYIRTENGKTINQKYPTLHYSLNGAEKVARNISSKLNLLLKKNSLSLNDCCGIIVGIAGARERKDKLALKKCMIAQVGFRKIEIETDAMIALHGAFGNSDGIILICGTGSVLYGVHNGELTRIGGWGKVLGDQGSGFWIGKEALRRFVDEIDLNHNRKKFSLLYNMIEKRLKLNKSNIVNKTFQRNFPFQKATPIVLECAMEDDKTSIEILNRASNDLLDHIEKFFLVTKRKKPIGLVFIGSVIENENYFSHLVKNRIQSRFKSKIILSKQPGTPAYGGYLLAQKYFSK